MSGDDECGQCDCGLDECNRLMVPKALRKKHMETAKRMREHQTMTASTSKPSTSKAHRVKPKGGAAKPTKGSAKNVKDKTPVADESVDRLGARVAAMKVVDMEEESKLTRIKDAEEHCASTFRTAERKLDELQSTLNSDMNFDDSIRPITTAMDILRVHVTAIQIIDSTSPNTLSFKDVFVKRGNNFIRVLEDHTSRLKQRHGQLMGLSMAPLHTTSFDTSSLLTKSLNGRHGILALVLTYCSVLNMLAGLSDLWSSFSLKFFRVLLHTIVKAISAGGATPQVPELAEIVDVADGIPSDIRTARNDMPTNPDLITYAVCPVRGCSRVYRGEDLGEGVFRYPSTCDGSRFSFSEERCGAELTTSAALRKQAIRVPVKTFLVRTLDNFVADLILRLEQELFAGLARFESPNHSGTLSNITDSPYIRNLDGPDGTPFMTTKSGDLRLAWILSIDWFNPYHNKAAGKSASVGSIVLTCANLPLHLRNKPENQFLIGVIPGPFEPTAEEMNNYLEPIVDMFLDSWTKGTYYSQTLHRPQGLQSSSIIAMLVADLLAAKKCAGFAPHNANAFCSICTLRKRERNDIAVNSTSWKGRLRNLKTHREQAEKWLNAPTKKHRDAAYGESGVRWSELLRLPYWDPTKCVVVDPMHNLFLGLVNTHIRTFLGMESEESKRRKKRNKKNKNKKKKKAEKQEVKRTGAKKARIIGPQDDTEKTDTRQSEPFVPFNELVGDEYFDERDEDTINPSDVQVCFTIADLRRIQELIRSIKKPSWCTVLPKDFGEMSHGKLKSDELKAGIGFEIPVIFALTWGSRSLAFLLAASKTKPNLKVAKQNAVNIRKRLLFESTMYLGIAIEYASEKETSPYHADRFLHYMILYLQSIRTLFPNFDLLANHHNALHLHEHLLRFGPAHCFWAYPFERLIGRLQCLNQNTRMDSLHETMMKRFSSSAGLIGYMQSELCADSLVPLQDCFSQSMGYNIEAPGDRLASGNGDLFEDVRSTVLIPVSELKWKKSENLDDDIRKAFLHILTPKEQAALYPKYWTVFSKTKIVLQGFRFSTFSDSPTNSIVCFRLIQEPTIVFAGEVQQIFSVYFEAESGMVRERVFFAISRFLPLTPKHAMDNPLRDFEEFGTSVWSVNKDSTPVVIEPAITPVSPAMQCPWGEDAFIFKPILKRLSR